MCAVCFSYDKQVRGLWTVDYIVLFTMQQPCSPVLFKIGESVNADWPFAGELNHLCRFITLWGISSIPAGNAKTWEILRNITQQGKAPWICSILMLQRCRYIEELWQNTIHNCRTINGIYHKHCSCSDCLDTAETEPRAHVEIKAVLLAGIFKNKFMDHCLLRPMNKKTQVLLRDW